jgi:hypothetical protein
MLAVTILTHNDNHLLFYTLKQLFSNTNFNDSKITFFVLLQSCSKAFVKATEYLFKSNCKCKYNIINEESNLGVSKANNKLAEFTKEFKYVLHLEDDWILHVEPNSENTIDTPSGSNRNKVSPSDKVAKTLFSNRKEWLNHCLKYLENTIEAPSGSKTEFSNRNNDISTVALRKYGSDKEKEQYGWTRCIPYYCHKYKDNFNYQNKLKNEIEIFSDNGSYKITEIENYLFTFNPTIRRNEDY